MTEQKSALKFFVRENSKECALARKILKKNGAKFNEIDVEREDVTGYLWRDFGTDEVPVLVSSTGEIINGRKKIQEFIKKKIE